MIPNNVLITESLDDEINRVLGSKNYSKVAVLVDENTERYCLPRISDLIGDHWLIKIQSGEENKHINTCNQIWGALTEASFDRKSLLINLGGGVIGDMGGFCAATYKRGIDFVNLPTTLLSQVDASVGGKLGVDFDGLKNHIGVFKDPESVIIATDFLKTLSQEELRSGFAEVIKHALIADEQYWGIISGGDLDKQDWFAHVSHSVKVKGDIVAQDPYENGLRKLLNFGHTVGHAVESTLLETSDKLLHGEAVALGMICEAYLSTKKAGLSDADLRTITAYITDVFGVATVDKKYFDEIVERCTQDKKNLNNVINCTMLKGIGSGVVDVPITAGEVLDSIFYYNQLNK